MYDVIYIPPLGSDIEVSSVNHRVRSHKARLLPMEEVGLVEKGGKVLAKGIATAYRDLLPGSRGIGHKYGVGHCDGDCARRLYLGSHLCHKREQSNRQQDIFVQRHG